MAYHITCPQSGVSVTVSCGCHLVDHDPMAAGAHHGRCQMNDLTANVRCPPEAGCCQEDHSHEATANACPGGHGACPEPDSCRLHESVKAHMDSLRAHAAAEGLDDHPSAMRLPDACPGGHCHKDLKDCTVCHPVIITAGEGSAVLRPVTA